MKFDLLAQLNNKIPKTHENLLYIWYNYRMADAFLYVFP